MLTGDIAGICGRCWRPVCFELHSVLHPVHPPVRLQMGVGLYPLYSLGRRLWRLRESTLTL